jgi:hypothetical protein
MAQALLSSTLFLLGAAMSLAQPCNSSSTALCLSAGRFEVTVAWTDFQGNHGDGQAIPLTADTGYFWFFTNTNVELVVKVLDARAINGHFWVFYGALSNVHYEITVRDSQTGDVQVYDNPSGQFASTGDTLAFPPSATTPLLAAQSLVAPPVGREIDESGVVSAGWDSAAACTPSPTALCLSGGRFRVEAAWKDFQDNTGVGHAVGLTGDTGYFWFFSSANVEAVVKVLDARVLNDHFWVFYGALSNVQYTLTVTDTVTGIVKTYSNPSGLFASVGDTLAFGKPTTFQLIDGGVVRGEIDGETALLYKVYAFFGDPRLPQTYAGEPAGFEEHGIVFEVANRWASLSVPTQQALEPFFTPPIYAASWFAAGAASARERSAAIRADWTRIETARAVVWYRAADAGGQTAANNIAAEVENVWTKEAGLMKHEPLTDAGQNNNGGEGKLDIYLLPSFRDPKATNDEGVNMPYPGQDSGLPRAVYILIKIPPAFTPVGARAVLSHEFFHAIAATYKNGFNGWLNEATATWMEDFVYPTQINNQEHNEAFRYLTGGYKHSYDQPASDFGNQNYLFLFYLARSIASAPAGDVVRAIWDSVGSLSSLKAIDASIPGGFAALWPEFALHCWNHPDVDKFKQWDNLATALAEGNAEPYIGLASAYGTSSLPPRKVDHLAISYAFVDVVEDSIQRIEIQNSPLASGGASAKVQAWIKLANGSTRVEDWTSKDRVVFCRDKTEGKVTKLLMLYTNSGQGPEVAWGGGKILYDSVGCGGFQGSAHMTSHVSDGSGTVDVTTDVTARFQPVEPDQGQSLISLAASEFTVRLTLAGQAGQCSISVGPLVRTFSDPSNSSLVIDRSVSPATYSVEADYAVQATETMTCPGGGTTTFPTAVAFIWLRVPPDRYKVNSDGSLSGSYTEGNMTWNWDLKPD